MIFIIVCSGLINFFDGIVCADDVSSSSLPAKEEDRFLISSPQKTTIYDAILGAFHSKNKPPIDFNIKKDRFVSVINDYDFLSDIQLSPWSIKFSNLIDFCPSSREEINSMRDLFSSLEHDWNVSQEKCAWYINEDEKRTGMSALAIANLYRIKNGSAKSVSYYLASPRTNNEMKKKAVMSLVLFQALICGEDGDRIGYVCSLIKRGKSQAE